MPSAKFIDTNSLGFETNSLKQGFISHVNTSFNNTQSIDFEESVYIPSHEDTTFEVLSLDAGISSGSILGTASELIMSETNSFQDISSGSILGSASENILLEHTTGDVNTNQISLENPSTQQNVILADVNHVSNYILPDPTPEPTIIAESTRDISRFRKSYSFTRNKPVRFRVTRRA
jgi:hypothetical protein